MKKNKARIFLCGTLRAIELKCEGTSSCITFPDNGRLTNSKQEELLPREALKEV